MPITISGPRGLALLRAPSRQSPLADIAALPKSDAAFVLSAQPGLATLNQSLFNARIEKHIDDVRRGDGALSAGVAVELERRDQQASTALAASDPESASIYAGYSTALGYDKKARFISSVSLTTQSLGEIPSKEESKAAVDELVKVFYPDR